MNEIRTIRLSNRRIVYLTACFMHMLMLSLNGTLYKMFQAGTIKVFLKELSLVPVLFALAWAMAYLVIMVLKVRTNWKV